MTEAHRRATRVRFGSAGELALRVCASAVALAVFALTAGPRTTAAQDTPDGSRFAIPFERVSCEVGGGEGG